MKDGGTIYIIISHCLEKAIRYRRTSAVTLRCDKYNKNIYRIEI